MKGNHFSSSKFWFEEKFLKSVSYLQLNQVYVESMQSFKLCGLLKIRAVASVHGSVARRAREWLKHASLRARGPRTSKVSSFVDHLELQYMRMYNYNM